ncbi:hypothetical protein MFE_03600 [Mycoplasmopsis fermentans JER]|nr:hypothetical protein MFE_03600 [Mycoplasmopsis fermentans JER]
MTKKIAKKSNIFAFFLIFFHLIININIKFKYNKNTMNHKGDILFGKIKSVSSEGLTILCNNDYSYFIPRDLITDWNKINLRHEFKIGEKINFIVEKVDYHSHSGIGNFKINHATFSRSPFKENLSNTKHGFENLKNQIDQEIKNYHKEGNNGNN